MLRNRGVNTRLAKCLNSVLNVKAVAAFNQENALVGAFSLITNLRMELFEALALLLAAVLGEGPQLLCSGHV